MSRRDHFAAQAMAAILSQMPSIIEDESAMSHLAFRVYRLADAMVKEGRVQEVNHGDA